MLAPVPRRQPAWFRADEYPDDPMAAIGYSPEYQEGGNLPRLWPL